MRGLPSVRKYTVLVYAAEVEHDSTLDQHALDDTVWYEVRPADERENDRHQSGRE